MRVIAVSVVLAAMLAFCAAPAAVAAREAVSPAPGAYGTAGGWGTMIVDQDSLTIDSMGANGHSCTVKARFVDQQWQASSGRTGAQACSLSFTPGAQGAWIVAGAPHDVCRSFCGQRAGFEGEYKPYPTACTFSQVRHRHDAARVELLTGHHAQAHEALAKLAVECKTFMDWNERNALANDQAVAAYDLGDKAECRLLSQQVIIDPQQLEQLRLRAPADYEAYKDDFAAAQNNLALCSE